MGAAEFVANDSVDDDSVTDDSVTMSLDVLTNAPETSERNQGAKGRIQVKYGGPTATRDQQSAARAAANPATPRTFVPRNTVW